MVDYRPALRERTGVGEYVHEIVRAYTAAYPDDVTIFTSSWKDRPASTLATQVRAHVVDRRIPVTVLNYLWHRLEWPPIEHLAGPADVVHAVHPLLIPATRAAQVITVHDLFFLVHPEQTQGEIRRDYVPLAAGHARRAHAIVTPSLYTKRLVEQQFTVDPSRIYVCPFGAPSWTALGRTPNVPRDGYFLFLGTLLARKNVGTLLDAYATLLRQVPAAPRLVIAGGVTADAEPWLARMAAPPLRGHVVHKGYVSQAEREPLYAGARALIMPSLDEGFGIPALEAMSAGVPVIASTGGALPEIVGDGGTLVGPTDVEALTAAMERVSCDDEWAAAQARAGLARARAFTWRDTAARLRQAYTEAIDRRRGAA